MHIFGYAEVEARIIHKDDHIGLPLCDVLLCLPHVTQNRGQMEEYRDEPHIGQFAVVLHTCATFGQHQVAAVEAELGFRVLILQRPHQS